MPISSEKGMHKNVERIRINLEKTRNNSYGIYVGHGIVDHLRLIPKIQDYVDRCVIITDSVVNPLYGKTVKDKLQEAALPVDIIEIPAGEPSKSIGTVLDVVKKLINLKASRKSLLIALGGGVVGDLTGFVASIFKRSIPYVQIATSLVAQVDSSVGGKTGIDLAEGKNLLGTFYQPKAVFIDLSFLTTLSDRDFKNGLAEIIKYGIISDEEMFELLEQEKDAIFNRQPALMKTLVERSCKIKANIVEADEQEGGLRRILNFGHTLGHAVEAASDYRLSHGEAVAIGTVAAARISHILGYLDDQSCKRIVHVIKQYGLPAKIPPGFSTKEILAFMASDKKAVGAKLHFVLIKKIGDPFVTDEVPTDIITDVIEELRT
ncbi:MAG: 3-dehydroquinate synthase [Deltaproteobacteria bacterium]|nr:3-dehydroquinate synthase [Deltaproteobacteria bacterium]